MPLLGRGLGHFGNSLPLLGGVRWNIVPTIVLSALLGYLVAQLFRVVQIAEVLCDLNHGGKVDVTQFLASLGVPYVVSVT